MWRAVACVAPLRVWRVCDGHFHRSGCVGGLIRAMAAMPNAGLVAVAGDDGFVKLFSAAACGFRLQLLANSETQPRRTLTTIHAVGTCLGSRNVNVREAPVRNEVKSVMLKSFDCPPRQ